MSAAWILDHVLTHESSHITCVDPFTGYEDDATNHLYERFHANVVENFPKKVTVMREMSNVALIDLGIQKNTYDIIYIDGDHHAKQVYHDAIMA